MKRKIVFLSVLLSTSLASCLLAQTSTHLTGQMFQTQLTAPIAGTTYNEAISGTSLARFAQVNSLGFYLDRRCPSDKMFSLDANNICVREFFDKAADQLGWGVSYPNGLVYVGPKEYTAILRTLFVLKGEDARKLPSDAAKIWARHQNLQWEEGTNPKELLESLADEAGVQIYGLDKIPHDIWGAGWTPSLSLANRVQFIVGQFGFTFKFDSTGLKIALIPIKIESIATVRSLPDGGQAQQRIESWKTELPRCQFIAKNGKVYVRGLVEDLERILPNGTVKPIYVAQTQRPAQPGTNYRVVSKQPAPTADLDKQRLTLPKVSVPPIILAQKIAERLGLQVEVNEEQLRAAGMATEKVIEFEIQDATVDQFFDALSQKAGCKMTRQGNKIIITP